MYINDISVGPPRAWNGLHANFWHTHIAHLRRNTGIVMHDTYTSHSSEYATTVLGIHWYSVETLNMNFTYFRHLSHSFT